MHRASGSRLKESPHAGWLLLAIGIALGVTRSARAEVREILVSSPLSRLTCIAEARVVEDVLAVAPGSIVAFEQRATTDQRVVVQLRQAGELREERALDASPGDCASLSEATSLVARSLLERNPEAPAGSAEPAALPAPAQTPVAASEPQALSAAPLRWGVLGRAGGNVGLFDAWSGTLSAGALLSRGRLAASLELGGWGRFTALARGGGQLHVRALGARLETCVALLRSASALELGVCGRAELGALHARASGFAGRNQRETLPFVMLAPVLNARWGSAPGISLGVSGGPTVALIQHRFTLTSTAMSGTSDAEPQLLFSSARWGACFDLMIAKIF